MYINITTNTFNVGMECTVKLMEKNVRIARGYATEKPIHITRHSASLNYRYGRKTKLKRVSRRAFASPGNSKEDLPSPEEEEAQSNVLVNSSPSAETCLSHNPSVDSAWGSPRSKLNVFHHQNDSDESKSCEEMMINSQYENCALQTFDRSGILRLTHPSKQIGSSTKNLESIQDFHQDDSEGG